MISQAVARHVLSHRTQPVGGWHIDTLIAAVTAGTVQAGSTAIRHRRREVLSDAPALLESGILIDGGRLRVKHKPDSVQHKPDSVQHKPGVSRYMIRYMISGTQPA